MTPMEKHQSQVAARVLEELKKRSMEGYYCRTAQETADLVSSLIADGETVTFGGSMTIGETGILDALKKRTDLTILDRGEAKSPEEVQKIYRRAFSCDTYLMSANAITRDGQLVNIDGNGNRVAALCFGPKQVLVIAGMNKVSETLEEAVSRAKNTAAPVNCLRLNKETPCARTGVCGNCQSPDCICSQTVITRHCSPAGRIKVILIEGSWGY